ncbi:YafY family transcriptional regulator [Bacillus sp. FJAT-49705]|uniref:YafY family transcriptional regulator n=1 Tax=Cytobacillus citreus TaxID=2833586 RepID=A0ABS5NY06_9BACI|nr:YafY family protein [Cytobacillus citreus]MBS4192730.1 YafY family transcriptional regulator [Cytobacillus citreus]
MKLDRLLTMTMILINRKKVKAQELAELFDVSIRTIYRDVDTLSKAGIPVISYQGANGGISLIEGYRVDKQVLTEDELTSISIALKSVLTSYQDPHAEAVLEKITGIAAERKTSLDYIFIDYSPWGSNALLKEKITKVKQAIETSSCLIFTYSKGYGKQTERMIEPHILVEKGRSWYVYGFCHLREAFRLFKVSRMKDIQLSEEKFIRKEINLSEQPWDKEWHEPKNTISLKLSFSPGSRLLMEESFGVEFIKEEQSIVEIDIPEDEWLYGFILSFGNKVEVLEPLHIREIIKKRIIDVMKIYTENI